MEIPNKELNNLAKGVSQGLVGSVGGRFLSVLGSIIAARVLGPAVYGLYAVGWTIVRFFSQIITLGMDRAFLRFAPKYWGKDNQRVKGLLYQVLFVSLLTGLAFGLIFFFVAPILSNTVYKKPELELVFRINAFIFPALSLLTVIAAATKITKSVKYSVILQDLGQPLLDLILMVFLFLIGLRLKAAIYSDIFSFILLSLLGISVLLKLIPDLISPGAIYDYSLKELFNYSLPAAFGGAFSVYIFWVDRILVGFFRSSIENGIYLAASQISTIFLVIMAGIYNIVIPLFSESFTKNDFRELNETYRISTKWGFYIGCPFLILLLISPSQVISGFYGNQFSDGVSIIIILTLGQLVNLITGSVGPLIIMTGNQKFLFRLSTIILASDIILNIILIPKIGIAGAAISTSISLSIQYFIEVLWVKKNLNLWPYDKKYLKGITSLIITMIVAAMMKYFIHLPTWPFLFLQIVIIFSSFFGMLVILKLDVEDKYFLMNLFPKRRL
jgi:O-antigen/teichoic acid export membrane protein